MKKKNILKKIDALYTKATKVLIGDIPLSQTKANPEDMTKKVSSVVNSAKEITKHNIDKIKTVGLKQTILSAGTPNEKEVLYKEVVKREKEELKALKKQQREEAKAQKALEQAKKKEAQAAKKVKTQSKKKTVKKPETKRTTKKVSTKKETVKTDSAKPKSAKKPSTKKTTSKKETVKTTTNTKPTKKSTAKKPSKRDAKIALYIKDIKKHYTEVDEAFVAIVVKNLGPSIYNKDAELVSCSEQKELDTVRRNFLIKKLGLDASKAVLDAAIADVCQELKGVRRKYRATFYYALAKKFKKESALS